jgi:hypothetical protein
LLFISKIASTLNYEVPKLCFRILSPRRWLAKDFSYMVSIISLINLKSPGIFKQQLILHMSSSYGIIV